LGLYSCIMKKNSWLLPAIAISLCSLFSVLQYIKVQPTEEEEIPGNPGWYAQWYELKKDQDGFINWNLYHSLHDQVNDLRALRGGGALFTGVTERGPNNVGGRTRAMLVDYADSSRIFAGGVSGGLWVSTNMGANWSPVNDNMANLSITSITQNPFNHDVFYYSGGEMAGNSTFINYYGAGINGNGVYKSTDGGLSFSLLPSTTAGPFNSTWQITHSISDTNEVYVGTGNDGLWRTQDAGASFINVLPSREITDIEVFDDGSVIVAADSYGLYYSATGDVGTFSLIGGGLPATGTMRRIVTASCRTNQNYMYAMYSNISQTAIESFWQSTNQGVTWTERTNPSDNITIPFPWYSMMLFVDDNQPQQVIVGGVDIAITFGGGDAWIQGWDSHADYHIGMSDPANPDYYYVGNDGGVHRYDVNYFGATSYELNTGYNVTQFYAGCFFPDSIRFWGGTQDNGTQSGNPSSLSHNHIFGGDGAFCAVNQQADYEGYVSWQNGHIQKTTDAHSNYPSFYETMNEMDGDQNGDIDDDTWFINPFEINELDGQQLYFPTRDRVWHSINGADNWEALTNGISNFYSIGVSYSTDPIIYCGGTSKLYRVPSGIFSTPGSEVSLSSSIPGPALGSSMTCISVSPKNAGTLFISLGNISNNPRIYRVTNATTATPTWTSIHGDLPTGMGINWVDVSPYNEDYLVIATDFGVFTSSNGGVNWLAETDIPNVPVHQVKIRNSDCKVFVFTHGRGIWTANMPTTGMGIENNGAYTSQIYPTATTGNLQIQTALEDYSVEVYSLSGQKILSAGSVNQISIAGHAAGMYLVTLVKNGKHLFKQKVFLSK
jgi:hypothetical protein